MAEVEKAVENMDSKEIEGRRLRVRGSKVRLLGSRYLVRSLVRKAGVNIMENI